MANFSNFKGKNVLVTGGSTGIGLAAAKQFAQAGARVAIVARSEKDLFAAAAKIGDQALPIVADVSSLTDLDRVFATIKQELGQLDSIFVNAGIAPFSPITEVGEQAFDQLFNVNVKGTYFTIQKALPLLTEKATIVLNSSIVNVKGFAGTSVYAATKAAVRSLARTLSAELAENGIRVNAVSPGPIETPIYGKLGLPEEQVQAMGQSFSEMVPLKRFGQPEEVAKAVLFLASQDSSYIVGSELAVDGGLSQI